jgi:hypothetical protein
MRRSVRDSKAYWLSYQATVTHRNSRSALLCCGLGLLPKVISLKRACAMPALTALTQRKRRHASQDRPPAPTNERNGPIVNRIVAMYLS